MQNPNLNIIYPPDNYAIDSFWFYDKLVFGLHGWGIWIQYRCWFTVLRWKFGSFIMPISAEREMEHFSAVLFGYNGLWIPAIVTAIMIFTSVPKPESAS